MPFMVSLIQVQKATQTLVAAKFVWHDLKKNFREWANTYLECQWAKVHRHAKAPLTVPSAKKTL